MREDARQRIVLCAICKCITRCLLAVRSAAVVATASEVLSPAALKRAVASSASGVWTMLPLQRARNSGRVFFVGNAADLASASAPNLPQPRKKQ